MNAKEVKRLLGRYRDMIDRNIKAIEKLKDREEPMFKPIHEDRISISGGLLVVGRLEIENIDEAVEWLNKMQDYSA